jgi:transposase-like protein
MTKATPQIDGDCYYRAQEAARLLGSVHPSTVRRWIKKGKTGYGALLGIRSRDGHQLIAGYRLKQVQSFLSGYPLPGPGSTAGYRKAFREAAAENVAMDCEVELRQAERQSLRAKRKMLKASSAHL